MNGNIIIKSALNILFIFILIDGKSQIVADAGANRVACVGQYGVDTIEIGGNPSANGGSGNYTYIWETCDSITIENLTYYFTASDFLDDTTKANPKVINAQSNLGLDKFYFKLTVTDDLDSISIDSMNLIFSFKRACKGCRVKSLCTRSKKIGKIVQRNEYAIEIEQNKKRIENNKVLYKKRQSIVEHPYGTIKRQWGFNYIMTKKTIERASTDVGLC